MVSIFDVARKAGVSKSTVSRVICGLDRVNPQTRERIQAAMAELGYVPNYFGQCLRGQRTHTVGILIPDFSNPFYSEVFKGIDETLRRHGAMSMVCHTGQNPDNELACVKQLLGRKVDGLIYFTYDQSEPVIQCLLKARQEGTPVVFMDPILRDEPLASVTCNGFEGSRLAAAYLLAQGRRRLGYIKGPERHWVTQERLRGFERALKDAGRKPRPGLVFEGDFTLESGREGARRLMAQTPAPDAIMAATDLMAVGALEWLRQAGARVPEDVAVVGFDNIPLARLVAPALTTVAQPIMELGRQAAQMVVGDATPGASQPARLVLECSLVVRASTEPATRTG